MKRLPSYFFPNLIVTALIGIVWLFKGPTDQELLANAAKALDFNPWSLQSINLTMYLQSRSLGSKMHI